MENKKNSKKKSTENPKVTAMTNSLPSEGRGSILSDILGSYTGIAADGGVPEQDADDL